MKLRIPSLLLLVGNIARPVQAQSSGLVQKYCSTQNTAGNYAAVNSIYNSDGSCTTLCQSSYAFAIVQGQNCWCSNLAPSNSVASSQCNQPCPGFPDDKCGNVTAGLFGYIALTLAPSGTFVAAANSPEATSTSSTASSSTSLSPTSSTASLQSGAASPLTTATIGQGVGITTVVSYVTPSTTSSTSTTDTSTTPDPSAAAVTSVQVVTVSGAVVYKTVTSTPIPASGQNSGLQQTMQNGLPGGAIAGIVIGVLAGIAAILLAFFLLWRRRRRDEDDDDDNNTNEKKPKRNISVLSRSGLLARATHHADPSAGNERDFDEPIQPGSSSQRHSMLFGAPATAEGVSPNSPLETTQSGDSGRRSEPMVYDQRLNPSALWATHDNGSRSSMQDGADYSRTLGVTNPDPRASFESRA